MGVNRMDHRSSDKTPIDEPPDLDVAEPGVGVDAKRIEGLAVDFPPYARRGRQRCLSLEHERAASRGLRSPERLEFAQPIRDAAVVPRGANDVETHEGTGEVSRTPVLEDNLAANRMQREVHDEFNAFGGH